MYDGKEVRDRGRLHSGSEFVTKHGRTYKRNAKKKSVSWAFASDKNDETLFTTPPTLSSYSYKTTLSNQFEYYVKVNSVVSQDNPVIWNCTLLQPTDDEEFTRTFMYPSVEPGDDQAFWKNLKPRKTDEQGCKQGAESARAEIEHELALIEKEEVTPVVKTVGKKDLQVGLFQAVIACSPTERDAQNCLEHKDEKKLETFSITGFINYINGNHVKFTLYEVKPYKKGTAQPLWIRRKKEFIIRKNPDFLIWKTYKPLSVDKPDNDIEFEAKISCKGRTSTSYGNKLFLDEKECFKKPDGDVDVTGKVTNMTGNGKIVSFVLFLGEQQLFVGGQFDGNIETFTLKYDLSIPFWRTFRRRRSTKDDESEKQSPMPSSKSTPSSKSLPSSKSTPSSCGKEDGNPGKDKEERFARDVRGDGSCFFYALWNGLSEKNLLQKVAVNFKLKETPNYFGVTPIEIEDEFAIDFRDKISKNKNYESELKKMIQHVKTTPHEIKETPGWKKTFTPRFLDVLNNVGDDGTKIEDFKKLMKKIDSWSTSFDVEFVKNELKTIGIDLVILVVDDRTRKTFYICRDKPERVILINRGDAHYNWLSDRAASNGGGKSMRNGRRISQRSKTRRKQI